MLEGSSAIGEAEAAAQQLGGELRRDSRANAVGGPGDEGGQAEGREAQAKGLAPGGQSGHRVSCGSSYFSGVPWCARRRQGSPAGSSRAGSRACHTVMY